ncbi:CDP-archaeol synthase [Methylocella silvestris]|uniref:CDP-archaeol synthase n=1 Tax=Methylocella silvestris TaxID=199596 RepID=A0A2J7TIW6_METSI|nr:CDP-archaeol synthase [Methylocella silvestris]PNG26712.1 hypothetical protein CR492_06895 [Methylocella silvestris]
MSIAPIAQALILVFVANGAPILASRVLGLWGNAPLDLHARFSDGARLLGSSKTFRGVIASLIATTLVAPAIGVDWRVGALAASAAMTGDIFSSFIKRRLQLPAQGMAPGIDQAPESLLPLIVCKSALGLSFVDVLVAAFIFWVGALLLSRALFTLKIRERPY